MSTGARDLPLEASMGANCSSPTADTLSQQGLENDEDIAPSIDTSSILITNNNPPTNMNTGKVPPSGGLKYQLVNQMNDDDIPYDKDSVPAARRKTSLPWNNQVPLMDPRVVEKLVEKMKMMKIMKEMMKAGPKGMEGAGNGHTQGMMEGQNGHPPGLREGKNGHSPGMKEMENGHSLGLNDNENGRRQGMVDNHPAGLIGNRNDNKIEVLRENGHSPGQMSEGHGSSPLANGTVVDGKMPANGRMSRNGQIPPFGKMPPNGMFPRGTMPPKGQMPPMPVFPKLFGDADNASRIVRHMKAVFNSAEIQELCDEKMDPSERNIMFKVMQCKLAMEFKVLSDLGMLHLAQLIATGKLPPLLQLIFMGYQDDPQVMKELAFIGPLATKKPEMIVRQGDVVPDIMLKTCADEPVALNDLHLDKERPLVIFAASSS